MSATDGPDDPSSIVQDDEEKKLGITSFISKDNAGFSAVVKARFSDFLVHEVGMDGEIARLDSMDVPVEQGSADVSRKRKHKDCDDENDDSPTSWSQIQADLQQWVKEKIAQDIVNFLKDKDSEDPKYIKLPRLDDKDTRRAVHEWIRSSLKGRAVADTEEGCIRIWHKRFQTQMPSFGKFSKTPNRSKTCWPKDRPDLLQFVLYKENMDTTSAAKDVLKRLSGKRARMGYAGMKDKRAVTAQFCTVHRKTAEEVAKINHGGGRDGGNTQSGGVALVRVGNFRYVSQEIRLGLLKGNRFDIVLRNVQTHGSPRNLVLLKAAVTALAQHGFVNYFGMQRFGKFHDTHSVGIEVLKGDYKQAVDIIMRPKLGEAPRIAEIRTQWQERFKDHENAPDKGAAAEAACAKKLAGSFGRFMTSEVAILNSLVRKPLDYRRAFSCIPKTMRMMYLHALQSYLWNRVASHRIDTLGTDVVAGDLVSEVAGEEVFDSGLPPVKVVSEEDVQQKKFSLKDVVLPLVGSKTEMPTNRCGALFNSIVKETGLTLDMFKTIHARERDLAMNGDYRKLVCLPKDVGSDIFEYTDPLQPLLQTDFMKLKGEQVKKLDHDQCGGGQKSILAMVVSFTLPSSSYATVALRELMKRPTSGGYQSSLNLGGSPSLETVTDAEVK